MMFFKAKKMAYAVNTVILLLEYGLMEQRQHHRWSGREKTRLFH